MKHFLKMKNVFWLSFLCIETLGLIGCSDNSKSASEYDPDKPVEITDFTPKEGPARTRMYITGKNFGSDVSQISVRIGGQDAKVVGSNGEIIYCLVPSKAVEGTVEIAVGRKSDYIKASEPFAYVKKPQVTTLCGYIDEFGKTEVRDGTFDECGFKNPRWLVVDPKHQDHIYLVDGDPGEMIRKLDVTNRQVSTLINKGQGNWAHIRQISFSATGDTLLVANEQSAENATAVSILLRQNDYKRPQTIVYAKQNNACGTHPIYGELYYNSRTTGELFRYDWNTEVSERMFVIQGADSQFFIFFHPTGDYAYICVPNKRIIMKAEYNTVEKRLQTPVTFCGQLNNRGYRDGLGTNAILGNPMQGCFVKNEKYVEEGKDDVYDFYFCDQFAHAVRYLTPDSYVGTYAGRGSKGLNNDPAGYVDGDLLEEARFNEPQGLIYDSDNNIFYIAEYRNKRIRMIIAEE